MLQAMVNLFGPLSTIVSKLLDKLLPGNEAKVIRQKKELGRYLVRTAGIIDAYRQECTRLRKELQEYGQRPETELLGSLPFRFERISHLTSEFASTIGEIAYLRLFDAETEERLVVGALAEFEVLWPGTYARLCSEADEAARSFSLTGPEIQAFRKEAGSESPILIILDEQSRSVMITHVREAMDELGTAYERLSAFLSKNYAVWELFDVRGEYHRPSDSAEGAPRAKRKGSLLRQKK